jgi:Na+-driven multidrug efflux pump
VCSYNYGAKNYKRVRWSYWIVIIISVIYGAIIFALVGYVLNGVLLSTFDVNNIYISNIMLRINMLIIPMLAIAVGGMLLFQGTARWFYACIAAIMNGIIFTIPISFLMKYLSNHYGNEQLFLYTPLISSTFAAVTILVWGAIYLHLRFQDKHVKLNFNER